MNFWPIFRLEKGTKGLLFRREHARRFPRCFHLCTRPLYLSPFPFSILLPRYHVLTCAVCSVQCVSHTYIQIHHNFTITQFHHCCDDWILRILVLASKVFIADFYNNNIEWRANETVNRHVSILLFSLFPFCFFLFPFFYYFSTVWPAFERFFKENLSEQKCFQLFSTCISNFYIYMRARVCVNLYGKATDSARRLFTSVAKDKNDYRSLKVSLTSILATIYQRWWS